MTVRSRRRTSAPGRTETLTRRHICCQRPTTGLQETRQFQRSVFTFSVAFAVGDSAQEAVDDGRRPLCVVAVRGPYSAGMTFLTCRPLSNDQRPRPFCFCKTVGPCGPEVQSKFTSRVDTPEKIWSIHRQAQLSSGGIQRMISLSLKRARISLVQSNIHPGPNLPGQVTTTKGATSRPQ